MDLDESIQWIRRMADQTRYMNEIRLNVMLTTMAFEAGVEPVHTLDVAETTRKYREKGVIK